MPTHDEGGLAVRTRQHISCQMSKAALCVCVSPCAAQYAFLADLHSRRPRVPTPSAGTGLLVKEAAAAAVNVAH